MFKILLLDPGYPLEQKQIRTDMKKIIGRNPKIDVIIMEDLNLDAAKPLHVRFHEMLDLHEPDLIAVVYTKTRFSNAVDFELGALTCNDRPLPDYIVILLEKGIDQDRITKYVTDGLFRFVNPCMFTTAEAAAANIIKEILHEKKGDYIR